MTQYKDENNRRKIITLPNILSFLRICIIPFIIWLYLKKENYILSGGLLLLSGATDIIDGFIARKFNMTSELGKVLDPIADKFTQGAVIICLLVRFPLMWVPLVILAAKEVFMAVSGLIIIKKTGVVLGAHWHGKLATVLLYAMMFIHISVDAVPYIISNVSIVICSCFILLSFILYAVRNLKILIDRKG